MLCIIFDKVKKMVLDTISKKIKITKKESFEIDSKIKKTV